MVQGPDDARAASNLRHRTGEEESSIPFFPQFFISRLGSQLPLSAGKKHEKQPLICFFPPRARVLPGPMWLAVKAISKPLSVASSWMYSHVLR